MRGRFAKAGTFLGLCVAAARRQPSAICAVVISRSSVVIAA